MYDSHGTPTDAKGYTACYDWDKDKPAYEADLLVCRHCGYTIFMCDGVTKKPLPASVVAERCPHCKHGICGRCKIKMNSGGVCEWFIHVIDAMEDKFRRRLQLGSYG
jgi:hypothetical protein